MYSYLLVETTGTPVVVLPFFMGRRAAAAQFEEVGGRRLPLGGVNGYLNVRGKQGRKEDKFQGISPKKQHRTGHYDTAQEAAIAYLQMKEDLKLGMPSLQQQQKKPATPATAAAPKERRVGVFLGELLRQQQCVVPTVACALLSPQQSAAAAARGVAVAFADILS